jgi:hypothetical protein
MRHEDDEERNVFDVLRGFYSKTNELTSGKEHGRAVTGFARLAVVLAVLACGGRILWHALWTMPTALGVFIGSVVVFRVLRWYLRRNR